MELIRISKLMADRGVCSRREADAWITAGWVRVDGAVAVLGQRAAPDARIDLDPKAERESRNLVTIVLNKPIGWVSALPEHGYHSAIELIIPDRQDPAYPGPPLRREHLVGLVAAGRLDIDSKGLLVLTQDGRVARQIIGEDHVMEKEYLVRVAGEPAVDALRRLRHGLSLDGQALLPAEVEWLNHDQLRFVLREGKKRQIRRMCEAVGLQVVGLKRVRVGRVRLGSLTEGQWRFLRPNEQF